MSAKKVCFQTTPRLVAQQRRFWNNYPDINITISDPRLMAIEQIRISDEHPDPNSILAFQTAIKSRKRFPPILVKPHGAKTAGLL